MAVGDITGVEISPSGAEPFGACADITISGFTTGKTIDFGSGRNNELSYADIASATIVFTVVSEGYNSSGTLGTVTRTLYATKIVRKPYPNQTSNQEPSATVIRVALSDFVYDDDNTGAGKSGTAPTVTIAANAIRNDGGSSQLSNAVTNLTCTNSSTLDYPQTIARWDRVAGVCTADRVTAAFTMACRAYNRSGIACVKFDATGRTSSHNETSTATTRTKTQRSATGLYAEAYNSASTAISGFTDDELIDLRFRAYPVVGDANSIRDTNNHTTAAEECLGYNKATVVCDKDVDGAIYAVVSTTGNDSTGANSATLATAEGTPYLTIGEAVNDGANVIYLLNGTHGAVASGHARKTTNEWVVVTYHPTLSSKAGAIVQLQSSVVQYDCERLQYKNVTFKLLNTSSYLDGEDAGNFLRLTGVTFDDDTTGSAAVTLGYRSHAVYLENCDGDMGEQEWEWRVFSSAKVNFCFDGCAFGTPGTAGSSNRLSAYELVCCSSLDAELLFTGANTGGPVKDHIEISFNSILDHDNSGTELIEGLATTSGDDIVMGVAIVGNLFEKTAGTSALGTIAADSSACNADNVILWHNTFTGERLNVGYNHTGSTLLTRRNWSQRFNSFRDWNNKDDTFPTENAARVGSWPVGYGVGFFGNNYEISNFPGEYGGLNLTTGSPGYVDDNSYTGSGTGNGDYHPDTGSSLLGRIPTGFRVVTCDLFGSPVATNGDAGAVQVTPDSRTGTGAIIAPAATTSGSGYSKHTGTGAPVSPPATLSGSGKSGKTGSGALVAPAGTLSGSVYSKHSGTGAVSAPHPSLVSGSGYSKHTGTGALTAPAGTLSGSGSSGTAGSITTNQSAATANRSTRKSSGVTYKAAYINITLPDLTGQTLTSATLQLNATLNAGPMSNIDVYARAESDTGAWDDSSLVATLDALSLGTAVSTGNTLSSGTGTKTLNILGDASKGVAKFYADHPSGGDITVALVWSAFSGTPNGAFTSLTIGDDNSGTPEAIFSARSDATNYPRIILGYIGDPNRTGAGTLTGPAATLSGTGKSGKVGTGSMVAAAGTLAGSGISTHTGTGAITAPAATLSGAGSGNAPVLGTGALEAPMPLIASSGNIESGDQDLVGALTAPAGVLAGTAITGKTGTSALVAPKPVVAGSGKSTHTGTGALTAPHPSLIGGAGLNSPPARLGTGALVGTVPVISGTGFVIDGDEATVDSIEWYLTGASAEGRSQRSQAASLGGFRSGVPVRSMTWDCDQPMVGVEILEIGALNGYGTGSLEAITDDTIAWTPPGGTQGAALTLLSGGEAQLFGLDSGAWIKVRRYSTIPMVGLHAVQCLDVYNNVIGFSNVASADAVAGKTFYRAIMGHNPYSGPMINLALWLDAAANSNIQIGYEVAVAGEIQTIADEFTAPTGITFDGGTTDTTGLMIPSCPAGESFGIWIKMTIPADTDPSPRELNHIHTKFSDLTTAIHYDDLRGKYRIARNDYVTYGLWLGQDAAPDFALAADEEFASRPHTTSLSLAPSHTYNAVIRKRNKWGLWSQNTTATPLVMKADGEKGFVPPSAPSIVAITQQAGASNYPIISARYEPAIDGDNRAQFFVVWYTRDDTTPDPTDPPSGYGSMNLRSGIQALKFVGSGQEFVDETPIKALVRTRRAAVGSGDAFSPDTTQLPATGGGTIVVASELTGWPTTGLMKITTYSGATKEIVEYDDLTVGTGVSTFTVLSGGREQWGTTADATLTNDVIYPIEAVDSTNTEVTEYEIDGIKPGRPWGELLFGNEAAQEQAPIEGPDGVTEEYIDEPNNIYLLQGEGWTELWMDTVLVWKVFQDGNTSSLNAVYIPDGWDLVVGSVSGAGTGVFDTTSADDLYIVAGSTRRVHINASAMTITAPSFAAIGGLPEVAPQYATWEQYAGSLLQSWDPQRSDYRPYVQLKSDGELGFQWTVDNTLTQSEIMAL